eukprot:scaffold396_cov339-Prasinococcus_capsulatus_cf.AAC.18
MPLRLGSRARASRVWSTNIPGSARTVTSVSWPKVPRSMVPAIGGHCTCQPLHWTNYCTACEDVQLNRHAKTAGRDLSHRRQPCWLWVPAPA